MGASKPTPAAPQHPHPHARKVSYLIAVVVAAAAAARVVYGFMLQDATLGSRKDCTLKRMDLNLAGIVTGGLLSLAALAAIFRRSAVLYIVFMLLVAGAGGAQAIFSSPEPLDADVCPPETPEEAAKVAERREKEAERRKGLGLRRMGEAGVAVLLTVFLAVTGARARVA
jgi:hypothetical protein